MTTTPTIEQTLDKMRKAYADLKSKGVGLEERLIVIEAIMNEKAATDRIHASILGRPLADLFRGPRQIAALESDVKVLMADLRKREAEG